MKDQTRILPVYTYLPGNLGVVFVGEDEVGHRPELPGRAQGDP